MNRVLIFTTLSLAALPCVQGSIFHHKKYENPISKETLQPDKILFDRAINDIVHGRYEVARLTLNTLINTYDSSEYLAKAKLAIADSWYREGGAHGLAQAEAEYKDFELFYPNMAESAEAQWRVCQIHYKQMDKVDRDNSQTLRAEDECMQMVTTYPNSRYTPQATQMLRNVQEVLADKEFLTGAFYFSKGAYPAAQNRFAFVTQQFPLYSAADDALWLEAESYKKMGDRFENQQAAALAKIIRDYPLSDHVDEAKKMLTAMNKPIPGADPAAYERMKYDREHEKNPGIIARSTGFLKRGPDTHLAAQNGAPPMQMSAPPTPLSVPVVQTDITGGGVLGGGGVNDVTASTVSNSTAIDTKPDARAAAGGSGAAGTGTAQAGNPPAGANGSSAAQQGTTALTNGSTNAANVPPPTNHPYVMTKKQKKMREKALEAQKKAQEKANTTNSTNAPAGTTATPASSGTSATTPASTTANPQ